MVNIYQRFGKVLFNHKWFPCLFYQAMSNILVMETVNTYLFHQVYKVHYIVC